MFNHLSFNPLPGFSSAHLQTIATRFLNNGKPAPMQDWNARLSDGDILYCKISTPQSWSETTPTIALIHGLGGNHTSGYMIRFGRKLFEQGYRVLYLNLRASCAEISKAYENLRPYNGGNSEDVKEALLQLKNESPKSPLILIGFSLGGNVALKLAGELGDEKSALVDEFYAICAPLDLELTVQILSQGFNQIYHRYYLYYLCRQSKKWQNGAAIQSLYEYDERITAPQWGYKNAKDYYQKCSSYLFIPKIKQPCHILYAQDDPIIDYKPIQRIIVPPSVKIWISSHGGHMGFMGRENGHEEDFYWMDRMLLRWLKKEPSRYQITDRQSFIN
jgi:predicted alpha/beta-fold hydrolase